MAITNEFGIKLTVTDHSPEALRELEAALEAGLTECGLDAERWAKEKCPVGTPESTGVPGYIGGTLRNSIAFAVDGQKPQTETGGSNYKVESGNKRVSGQYKGNAPKEQRQGYRALYIGTNVYYAPYVEMGTSRSKKYPQGRPFIRPALADHIDHYKDVLKRYLEGTVGSID